MTFKKTKNEKKLEQKCQNWAFKKSKKKYYKKRQNKTKVSNGEFCGFAMIEQTKMLLLKTY